MGDKDIILALFKVILLVGFIIEINDVIKERGTIKLLSILGALCSGTMLVLIM